MVATARSAGQIGRFLGAFVTSTCCLRQPQAVAVLLLAGTCGFAPLGARGQFAGVVETDYRYAGSSSGANVYNGDTGVATATSLNGPSYLVFDSNGNLFVSDTLNNCVRKIDGSGNVSTVAGLRVSGGPDTCDTPGNTGPTAAQGLLRPAGLAIDSANTLYIADSLHNCVRSLATGAVDSFAANALVTVAGTCSSVDTASVTPAPNGLAVDGSGNLYVSLRDSGAALPVNQVVRHLAGDAATAVCLVAGQPSANVGAVCAGISGRVTLNAPAALAFDVNGNLFVADWGNNCVRAVTAPGAIETAVGQCANDLSGSLAATLAGPYGLAFSPGGLLYISEAAGNRNNVVSFAGGPGRLTPIGGLPSGAPGAYSPLLDGGSALSAALNMPAGLATDAAGNLYVADALNNVVREMSSGLMFPAITVGTASAAQTITFAINQAVNLSPSTGADYVIASTTCSGALVAAAVGGPPNTCQAMVSFDPGRPGLRSSALQLKDSTSGQILSVGLSGRGVGPLNLFTPGMVSSVATGLRNPIAVSVDSAGDAYVLDRGNGASSAAILLAPAGGGAAQTIVPSGAGLLTPTAMAVDGAGNIFVADAGYSGVTRFGADGTLNTAYVTGLVSATALAVDGSGNLYIAQAGVAHNVVEVYAGGERRVVAGGGTIAGADGVPASKALLVAPSGLVLGPNGLSIADAGGNRVYTVDGMGTIHVVAGNGTAINSLAGQALGTALLFPLGLAADAAGDLYVTDEAANRIYEVYPVASGGVDISTVLGSGVTGYSGDGGLAPLATLNAPNAAALDGSGDLFVVDSMNGALRDVAFPVSPDIDFGHVIIGTTSAAVTQAMANAGNAGLALTTPFTTTDAHFAVSGNPASTTCGSTLAAGAVCGIGFSYTPTVLGPVAAQSVITSNFYGSPQTVQLNAFGLFTQGLPFSLRPETEVYGHPFTQTAALALVYPDLIPSGVMFFTLAGETTCVVAGPFPLTVNCAAQESGVGVGTYLVNFAYSSADVSYFSATGTTTLTVTPAPLTVSPANETKAYGAPVPGLPGTITGAVNGDVFLLSDTTTATAASLPGIYPITGTLTPVGLATLANYAVTYGAGTLTVAGAAPALTVAVNNVSRAYGAANPVFSSAITGLLNGDTVTVTYATAATAASPVGSYAITATVSGAALGNYTLNVAAGTLSVVPAATSTTLTSSASPVSVGTNIAFTAAVSSGAGVPPGTVNFLSGSTLLGTGTVNGSGLATFSTSALAAASYSIVATYTGSTNFAASSDTIAEGINAGGFVLGATPPSQYVRGPSTTTYAISATSMQSFAGPVALSCSGLPADATCAFATPTLTVPAGGVAGTSMVVINTEADARLRLPAPPKDGGRGSTGATPLSAAEGVGFELTGLAALLSGLLRRKTGLPDGAFRRWKAVRLMLALLCAAGLVGFGGCACFTSSYVSYNVTITGTNSTAGAAPQSIAVVLSVGQQ
jgi:sugar lactone lactonase YvrE